MAETNSVMWNRKRYRLVPHQGGWRIRSRARGDEFDWQFPPCSLSKAKEMALDRFEKGQGGDRPSSSTPTLEDVVKVYQIIPKKAGAESAYNNECRLRGVVREVFGKELDRVFVTVVGPSGLWNPYIAKKQGGTLDFSLSGRKPQNVAINSAIRQAAAIFIKRLRPLYKEYGINIPDDATVIQWLPEMKLPKPPAKAELIPDWRKLKDGPMYWTIGLARFAGLRQQEISMCQPEWIVKDKHGVYVLLHDRPDENAILKTGEMYRAMVIDKTFAKQLLKRPKGQPIVETPPGIKRDEWFERKPQAWLKPYTGTAKKPLHRLRGLYADEVKKLTQDMVAAYQAGVKAASQNLGHTNTNTTRKSYLS